MDDSSFLESGHYPDKSVVSDSEPSIVYDSSYVEDSFIGVCKQKSSKGKFIIESESDSASPLPSPLKVENWTDFKKENGDENPMLQSRRSVSFKFDDSVGSCDEEVADLIETHHINEIQKLEVPESDASVVMVSDSDTYEFKSEHSECETEFASYRSNRSEGSKNSVHLSQLSNTKNSMDNDECSVSSFGGSGDELIPESNKPVKKEDSQIASISELLSASASESDSDCHTSGPEDDVIEISSDQLSDYDINAIASKRSISPVKQFPIKSSYQVLDTGSHTMERLIQLQMEAERIGKQREKALQKYHQLKEIQLKSMPASLPEVIKLITSIKKSESLAKEYSERLAFLNKKIANKQVSKESKTIFDHHLKNSAKERVSNERDIRNNKENCDINNMLANIALNHLPSSSSDISEYGKQALATHNKQRALTVDALERMHWGLATLENPDNVTVSGIRVELLSHQKFALNWMLAREKLQHPSGGILADDMGLGKTLTMISLIVGSKQASYSNNSSDSSSDDDDEDENLKRKNSLCEGGTLVICPASVIGQWENEIKNKIKPGLLSYVVHHGPKRETREIRLARYDVVLSTYTILQKSNKLNDFGPLLNIRWKRIVLDEAHLIRNHKTGTALSAFLLKGKHRWCLTGTPIQNKSLDIFSLLKFLKCRPFDDIVVWKRWVDNKDSAGAHRLSCIIKSILLRRTKAEMENLNLKTKTIDLVKIKLDQEEMDIYKKVAQLSGALFAQFIQQKAEKENLFQHGAPILKSRKPLTQQDNPFTNNPEMEKLFNEMVTMGKGISSVEILVLLLRLRQLCCHPSLITKMFDKEDLDKESDALVESDGTDVELVDKMMRFSISPADNEESVATKPDAINCLTKDNPIFKKERVSSKVRKVIEYLKERVLVSQEDKALIISQFTSVLDIFEEEMLKLNIKFCSLTGKVKVADRGDMITKFNLNGRGPRVMLLSLVAGGTGLNLVGANHLLFVDVHWNPQLENQAFDRVYRIGQTKDVFIYKFVCEDTIEERILKLQEMKLKLAENVLTGTGSTSSTKLTLDDLKMLFQVKQD